MNHSPIDCELHDHLEIACMFGYKVRLTLRDGAQVEGVTTTTTTLSDKTEVVTLSCGDDSLHVAMHEIAILEVLTDNARFRSVDFRDLEVSLD